MTECDNIDIAMTIPDAKITNFFMFYPQSCFNLFIRRSPPHSRFYLHDRQKVKITTGDAIAIQV